MPIKQVAIYGKGGIGKSTIAAHISAALSTMGYRVMQIGCDPKSDSTNTLRGGRFIPTVLDTLRQRDRVEIEDVVHEGFNGILTIEVGGPEPGVGCAGRGILTAIKMIKEERAFERYKPDLVIYDVLGDVVCGGFAAPIREGIAEQIYTVSSADYMALYAANNLFKGIRKYSKSGGALLGGIIGNSINNPDEEELLIDFARRTRTKIIDFVPRSKRVRICELQGKTVIECAPDSKQAEICRELAKKIIKNEDRNIPSPMKIEELQEWAAERLKKLVHD
ncbi:Ni-sirohydrochlorin a,c-diamide reductive cyclase complex, component CfbC [Candidatus Methanoperedenaceae archaeon GB50]|nr:Ni-sirohydrochlorin a,c-diamide reductive cyclase complex, component CfbC [Candidatus Methanoperedenaceae archaeon GB37]CAD7768148.1 Ni-sirohydrochlorin a,c-diamide reductive cyclase complex, component CfbC [Candidatus Methanoperedenaceae archaeon GB50]